MFTTETHVLARGARQEGERVLLTCPLSQRCLDHVRCRKSQIILFPPPRLADRALPVLSVRHYSCCCRLRTPVVYPKSRCLDHVFSGKCQCSSNPTQANPSMAVQGPFLGCAVKHHTAHASCGYCGPPHYCTPRTHSSYSSTQITLLFFPPSTPSLLFLTPTNIAPRVTAATLPSPLLIVRHKLGC